MKRKILIRFFSVTLASTLFVFIFGFIAVKLNAESVMEERLIEETKIVALMLDSSEDFEKFKAYEGNDKFRITVFDTEGNVIMESDTRAELENHRDRVEIQDALNDNPTVHTRYSKTFDCEMTYYAMKVNIDNRVVVLRLAIRGSELASYLSVTLPSFIIVLIIALVMSVIISHFISVSISSKIDNVGQSLKSINKGEYVPIKTDSSEPELYSVLCEINELNESTRSHIIELEREQKKLGKVLESISQGIIAVNDRREVVFANKSAFALLSGDKNAIGKELVVMLDQPPVYERICRHLNESYSFECDYNERALYIVIHEIAQDEMGISSILIITDITDQRAMARQKSEFFANASHELKTPVTVMQGLSELLLQDEGVPKSSAKRIERIHKESVRLGSLISDMLKLSRLESGDEMELSSIPVDLRATFEEALEEQRVNITEKNLSCSVTGNGTVMADPKKIYELAQNLCSNAVNYNKQGGEIKVSISSGDEAVLVTVADTGIGIEEKHIPLLCQRFYRVDKSHSKKTGGTGLGLAIVKHICALYGASLQIKSTLGVGTQVRVEFKKQ